MRISGLEFSDELVGRIRQVVQSEPALSRSALSRRICEWQGWRSPNGRLRQMSCRVALLKLERQNAIRLPASRGRPAIRRRVRPAAPRQRRRYGLSALQPIEVVRVGSADSQASRIWNELMERHHPLGAGPLCGQQLRYLIGSAQLGWLGGLAFSAAAWQLKARDGWIGWTAATRRQNLSRVIANSRFLIRPELEVPNLASHVLKLALGRVVGDWQQRYGCEPVLVETFVETGRFRGTCYQAANWIQVGQSAGRGRQDRHNRRGQAVKDIYLYRLHPQACQLLTTAPTQPEPPVPVRSVLPAADWAEEEFGGLRLGDRRLEKRAVLLARDLGARPQAQIPQACQTRARTQAAYRFFAHPATDMNRLLESHYQATRQRVAQQKVVLAVQDTTSLNYSAHPATEDLGPIGSQPEGPLGLLVHDTMAFTVEGTPLGLLDLQCWARDGDRFGKKHDRKQRPIEDKESSKWLESFRRVAAVQQPCPQTQLVSVADRESDIYELFHLAQQDPRRPAAVDPGRAEPAAGRTTRAFGREGPATTAGGPSLDCGAAARRTARPGSAAGSALRRSHAPAAGRQGSLGPFETVGGAGRRSRRSSGPRACLLAAVDHLSGGDLRAGPGKARLVLLALVHRGLSSHPEKWFEN